MFKINVVKASMSDVFDYNTVWNQITNGDDVIDQFGSGSIYLSKEKSFDLMKEIDSLVLNHKKKGTRFSKDDYTISFKSTDTDVFTIDENGMINAVMTYDQLLKSGKCDKEGNYNVDFSFTIKFSDNSVYNGIFYLWVTK